MKIEIFKSGHSWYVRLKFRNGRVFSCASGYNSVANAKKSALSLMRNAAWARIVVID